MIPQKPLFNGRNMNGRAGKAALLLLYPLITAGTSAAGVLAKHPSTFFPTV